MATEPNLRDLLDLVGSIYSAALSENGWSVVLERATQVFGGNATVFFVKDRAAPDLEFAQISGLPEAAMEEFGGHFAPLDIGIDALLALPSGSVVTEESVAPEVYRNSEIYNDFRRRWDVERYMAVDVFRDARRFGVFGVQAPGRRAAFDTAEMRVLELLQPHLRRAVQARSQLEQTLARQRALEDVVEGLVVGVVLLDGQGEVVHANATARRIAGLGDGLAIHRRRLRAAASGDDRMLQRAIRQAIDSSIGSSAAGGAALSVQRTSGERPWSLLVNPGPGVAAQSPYRSAAAVVLIGDPGARLAAGERLAAAMYGLTPAEARVACAVTSGESLESYAALHGLALSTARWTMKRVLEKTGARRQADLVRMLLAGPLAAASPRDADRSG